MRGSVRWDRDARGWRRSAQLRGHRLVQPQQLLGQSAKKLIQGGKPVQPPELNSRAGDRFRPRQTKRGSQDWNVPATHVNVQRPRKHQVSAQGRRAGCRQRDCQVCPQCLPASWPPATSAARLKESTPLNARLRHRLDCLTELRLGHPVHHALPVRAASVLLGKTFCNPTTAVTAPSSSMSRSPGAPTEPPPLRTPRSPGKLRAIYSP